MANAFDAASTGNVNPATSLTVSHTCTGSNLALVVGVVGDTSDVVTGVTYNGVSLTQVAKLAPAGGGRWEYLYYLNAPATGAHNVVVSASGSVYLEANSASYTGVKQSGQPEANNSNRSDSASSLATSVTTVTDNAWVVLVGYAKQGTLAASTGCTRRATTLVGAIFDSNGVVHPAGSYSETFTQASADNMVGLAAALAPAATASITGFTDSAGTTITTVPSNHGAGTVVVKVVGSGTNFQAGDTWTASNSGGSWAYSSKVVNSTTSVTLTLTCPVAASPPVGATGTLTITNTTLSLSGTLTVSTPTVSLSVTSGATGGTQAETLTGANTLWANETAAGLFTLAGGTGASISDPPTGVTNTAATDTITKGSAAGALTVTDTSTGAQATFTVTAGTIAITAPVQYQWKRGGGSAASFTVSGTYTGSVTTVQVSSDGGSTWATLDAAPSGGNYTGTVSLAASETDYTVQVRFSNATSVTASVANIANVRYVLAIGGQSNEAGRGTSNQTAEPVYGSDASRKKTAASYALLADPSGTDGGAAGSYAIHEMNVIGAATGRRWGLCNFAVGNTDIAGWQKGSGSNLYEPLAAAVTAVGGACDILRMGPCENDAQAGTTQSAYHAGLASFVASWLADFPGTKIVWRALQHLNPATETQPHQDAINAAITQAAGTTHGKATGDVAGVYLAEVRSIPAYPGDNVHWLTDQQLADVGGIMATADYAALNPASGGGAPVVGSAIVRGRT